MKPKLVVEQKITAFANKYEIYMAQADSSKGDLLALAQQKRFAFREKVTFFSDATKSQAVFSFRAEKVLDVHGRYIVEDENGQVVGSFRKEFTKSLFNSTWNIQDEGDHPKLIISESNQTLAIVRRYGSLIPILGAISEIVTSFLRYHFDFREAKTKQLVGKYQKTKLFRDHYLLSMDDDIYSQTDWRVFAAVTVALDALQSR